MSAASAQFAALWNGHEIAALHETHKTIEHPQLGPVHLDCDVLRVDGADLRVVLFTAAPGTPKPMPSASWHRSTSRPSSSPPMAGVIWVIEDYPGLSGI